MKELCSDEHDLRRSVSDLSTRIEAPETAHTVIISDGTAWLRGKHELGALSKIVDVDAGWKKAFTTALDVAAEALVSEGSGDPLIDEPVAADKGNVVIINSVDASNSWRLDIALPAQAS